MRKIRSKQTFLKTQTITKIQKRVLLILAIFVSVAMTVKSIVSDYDGTMGPEMTKQTWPAGTFLSNFPEGDRIHTYHRNYLMMNGQSGTSVWDISNPTAPKRIQFSDAANNGHRWWKLNGDVFYREYSVPELEGTGYQYLDLSNMLDRKPVTSSDVLFTVEDGQGNFDNLETFPHTIVEHRVFDMITGERVSDIPVTVNLSDVVVRIGNYVFYAPQKGDISVFDFGNPNDIKFLGSFGGDIPHEQYSTGIQLWRNYLIFMSGKKGPDALVGFDISDPTNVKKGFSLHSDDITLGRYMIFQDEFGFTGHFDRGVKFNFETMELEQEFRPSSTDEVLQFIDFQWMPIGHVLVASGDNKTSIFAHQEGLDTKPPTVGHHFPVAGAINQPVTTTLGFVINETLNDLTINDKTIQVSPIGGDPIEGHIVSKSYQVVSYVPKEELLPNTTYEVKFVEGGIKDAVGNGMEEYVFFFTTGGGDGSNQSPEATEITLSTPSPIVINSNVDFTVNATDPDGDTLVYRWNFGDGSPISTTGATATHSYSTAGNFEVQVQISDNNGGFIVVSQSIVVTEPLPQDLPTQTGPIAIDAARRIVWTVNPDNNTVTMLNADTLELIREVAVGNDPVSIALDNSGNAWIASRDDDSVYVLSKEGALLQTINLDKGSRPYGIVFTPDGNKAFVSAFGSGKILEISPATNTVTSSIAIGQTPRSMAVSGDSKTLWVTRFISPDSEGQIWEIDLDTFSLRKTISLPLDDFTQDTGSAARGLPNYVSGITIHPNSKSAWSVAKKDNILRGEALDGKTLTFDNSVRTAISPIDLTNGTENLAKRMDIDNHGQPSAALYSPNGNYVFLSMQGNNHLIVVDPVKGLELLEIEVGKAPQGLAIDPTNNRLFVKNFMDRSVTVFDAQQIITNGVPILEPIQTINTVQQETLTSQLLEGKQIFYNAADLRMGTDGYVSCASCHIDGTQDGRTWDFTDRGEGLRNTISLRGKSGTGHGRVHWSANFDEIQDFENDIRLHFSGQGFMDNSRFNKGTTALPLGDPKAGKSPELDALTAYIESLNSFDPSPNKTPSGRLTSDAVAGKALFENLKCYSCHSGSNFTDSNTGRLHDVGTIEAISGGRLNNNLIGIDVPTLKDLWATAPYLHHGKAKTLQEVFTTYNTNNAHGQTSNLSSTELNQLEAYLKQLDDSEQNSLQPLSTLQMTSPIDGSQIESSGPILLETDTDIQGVTKVEYYIDGELTATADAAPFTAIWNPDLWKTYSIVAKVFYNNNNTASITPEISVKYKNTIQAMFVVANADNLSSEEQRIKSRLEQNFGFEVTVFSDEDTTGPTQTIPFDIILISSTTNPSILGGNLEASPVPLITWNTFMYEKLGMTEGDVLNTDFGITSTGFSTISITEPTHPMAAGISTETPLYSVTQGIPFGKPTEEAIVIAKAGENAVLFGYEANSTITSRRVAFPLRDQFMHLLTENGLNLFDSAIIWTLYGGDADNPIGSLPDVFFKSPTNGGLVNAPLTIDFITESWDLPSTRFQLRFLIDGEDRGVITEEGSFTDDLDLSEGQHELTLRMEKSDNTVTNLGETIKVKVTKDPLPSEPAVFIQSPTDGGTVGTSFDIEFFAFMWDIVPGGQHVKYFIDGAEQGSVFETAPISIDNISGGSHVIRLALANADGTLTGKATEVTIVADQRLNDLPDTDFSVEYMNNSSSEVAAEFKPIFQIVSESDQSEPLNEFTIRYWYTPEHSTPLEANVDFTQIEGVTTSFGEIEGEKYMEVGFDETSGNIAANGKSGVVQTRVHHSNFLTQDQGNDYSYAAGITSLTPHVLVTLYRNNELVWGVEPEVVSFLSVEEQQKISFKIYPNPVQNELHIENINASNNTHIQLFDALGRVVLSKTINVGVNNTVLDTSRLSQGLYFLSINKDGKTKIQKIIK